MKTFLKSLVVLSLAVILMACGGNDEDSAGNVSADDEKKVLKMGTSADFPPFETRDTDGELIGFDIDLAHLIAEELGYELEIEDMKFDGLLGALQTNRLDMVMSGMSATEERKENADFSIEYQHSGEMFLSLKDTPFNDINELDGKKIGVQLGTIQEDGAKKLLEDYDFEIVSLDDSTALVQELLSKRIDAAYMDTEVAVGYLDAQDLHGIDDPTESSPGMGVAFPKDSELVEPVNEVLEKFLDDGTIEELREKWLFNEE